MSQSFGVPAPLYPTPRNLASSDLPYSIALIDQNLVITCERVSSEGGRDTYMLVVRSIDGQPITLHPAGHNSVGINSGR